MSRFGRHFVDGLVRNGQAFYSGCALPLLLTLLLGASELFMVSSRSAVRVARDDSAAKLDERVVLKSVYGRFPGIFSSVALHVTKPSGSIATPNEVDSILGLASHLLSISVPQTVKEGSVHKCDSFDSFSAVQFRRLASYFLQIQIFKCAFNT